MIFYLVVPPREEVLSHSELSLHSDCNLGCSCSSRDWDPVCGDNGITYVSPCLAGCVSSAGSGRNTVRNTKTVFCFSCFGGFSFVLFACFLATVVQSSH